MVSWPTWMWPHGVKYFRAFLKLVSVVMSEVDWAALESWSERQHLFCCVLEAGMGILRKRFL